MDDEREQELLTYVAAGTDPLTAFAALPRDEDAAQWRGTAGVHDKPAGRLTTLLVLLAILMTAALFLL